MTAIVDQNYRKCPPLAEGVWGGTADTVTDTTGQARQLARDTESSSLTQSRFFSARHCGPLPGAVS